MIGLTYNQVLGGIFGIGGIVVPVFNKLLHGEDG